LFVEVEPPAGHRHVEVAGRSTRQDWARFIKAMLDERYPQAVKVRPVPDCLKAQDFVSLHQAFPAAESRRLAERCGTRTIFFPESRPTVGSS